MQNEPGKTVCLGSSACSQSCLGLRGSGTDVEGDSDSSGFSGLWERDKLAGEKSSEVWVTGRNSAVCALAATVN